MSKSNSPLFAGEAPEVLLAAETYGMGAGDVGGFGLPGAEVAGAFESQGFGDAGVEFQGSVATHGEEARAGLAGLEEHAVVSKRDEGAVGRGDDVVQVEGCVRVMCCPFYAD